MSSWLLQPFFSAVLVFGVILASAPGHVQVDMQLQLDIIADQLSALCIYKP